MSFLFNKLFAKIANKKGVSLNEETPFKIICLTDYFKKPSKIPAATGEPITPATFGPMACINK